MQRKTTAEEKSSTRNVRRKNADSGKSSAFRAWILLRPISRRLPDFGGTTGGYLGVVDAEAVSEADETKQEINVSDTYKRETAVRGGDRKYAAGSCRSLKRKDHDGRQVLPVENPESSSEDQSKEGRLRRRRDESVERVPFEEDAVPAGIHGDEDVFISHGESAFDDEDMFPDEKKRETKAWEKKPKVSVLSNIPDIPLDEPAADDDEIFESMRRDTEKSGRTPCRECQTRQNCRARRNCRDFRKTAGKTEFPETEENEKTAGIPVSGEGSMSDLSDDEFRHRTLCGK